LIKKFADATNKKAGEFYTPRSVVRLMIDMLDPKEGESIYDPACGTGGMLLAAVQHVKELHGDVKRLWGKLYGQEKNLTTSSIARMNLFLHGIEDFKIERGDTLRNPAFF
ncbi:N-6 DNA methylase, partial [Pseudomonas aeruginosa]|nr:N-6 DNA methylase [Pseudomonas aeruginosa]